MKTRIAIAVMFCLAMAVVAWPQAADDPLDSLKVCKDTQHLILENQFVRVIDQSFFHDFIALRQISFRLLRRRRVNS